MEEELAIVKYCHGCEFKAQCKSKGDRIGAEYGIWGGEKRSRSA